MRFRSPELWALALFSLSTEISSSPLQGKRSSIIENGIHYTLFEHRSTNSSIKFVENSGVCETTPGVKQYSGYFNAGTNESLWFWFFEARKRPEVAPLALWLNGGPGCSSMIGLFQENGPCHFVNNETTPSLNPYSWNEYANMLYIDQPVGVGFSYGVNYANTSQTAAPYVWKLLQAFFTQFPVYENRDFGLFTESYGGHYGPEFADYIERQNAAIDKGSCEGEKINLVALGINDIWIDAKIQWKAYIDYSFDNPYRPFINQSQYDFYLQNYTTDCVPAMDKCETTNTDDDCKVAVAICYYGIEGPLTALADFNTYDLRQPASDPNPPSTYGDYLRDPAIAAKIGAQVVYQQCSNDVSQQFGVTGDNSRSFIPQLSNVVNAGVNTLVWAGDADWECNWVGNLASIDTVSYPGQKNFTEAALKPYKLNGVAAGEFKVSGNMAFLKVYQAGHEIPYYAPELSLQVFTQTMKGKPIEST